MVWPFWLSETRKDKTETQWPTKREHPHEAGREGCSVNLHQGNRTTPNRKRDPKQTMQPAWGESGKRWVQRQGTRKRRRNETREWPPDAGAIHEKQRDARTRTETRGLIACTQTVLKLNIRPRKGGPTTTKLAKLKFNLKFMKSLLNLFKFLSNVYVREGVGFDCLGMSRGSRLDGGDPSGPIRIFLFDGIQCYASLQ